MYVEAVARSLKLDAVQHVDALCSDCLCQDVALLLRHCSVVCRVAKRLCRGLVKHAHGHRWRGTNGLGAYLSKAIGDLAVYRAGHVVLLDELLGCTLPGTGALWLVRVGYYVAFNAAYNCLIMDSGGYARHFLNRYRSRCLSRYRSHFLNCYGSHCPNRYPNHFRRRCPKHWPSQSPNQRAPW